MIKEQDAIRRAFERVEPPAGFAARVLERIDREEEMVLRSRWRRRWLRHAVAAGLALAIGLSAVAGWNWNRQKRGEAAAAEALIALRIASEKVNLAKQTVHERSAF
jgi:hypothetical protein